jgi:hypothetical protein
MRHKQLTFIAPVAEGRRIELKRYLEEEISYQCKHKPANVLLRQIPELHFLSMFTFVSPGQARNPEGYLVIEASFDGPVDAFLGKFTQFKPLNSILDHCKRDPSESAADYIRRHSYTPGCFYVSCPGLTRPQIDDENKLLTRLQTETSALVRDAPDGCRDSATAVAHMREVADREGFLASRPLPEPFLVKRGQTLVNGKAFMFALLVIVLLAVPWWFLVLVGLIALYFIYRFAPAQSKIRFMGWAALDVGLGGAGLALLDHFAPHWTVCLARVILILILIITGVGAAALYKLQLFERKDPVDPGWVNAGVMREVCQDENSPGCAQNHFINLSIVKPGALRRWTLRIFLWIVHIAGVVYYNKGKLGGIPSIHFARWVMLDEKEFGKPLLLFLTNYDGSWDSYLGDFVDDASEGVSGIWSNTGGFPYTFLLIVDGGSRNEKQFKAYARQGQLRSSAWFSAYPNVSVGQKLSNAELRRELYENNFDASAQDKLLRRL